MSNTHQKMKEYNELQGFSIRLINNMDQKLKELSINTLNVQYSPMHYYWMVCMDKKLNSWHLGITYKSKSSKENYNYTNT